MSDSEVVRDCPTWMGTGGVRVPCMRCENGESKHDHRCKTCGGTGATDWDSYWCEECQETGHPTPGTDEWERFIEDVDAT